MGAMNALRISLMACLLLHFSLPATAIIERWGSRSMQGWDDDTEAAYDLRVGSSAYETRFRDDAEAEVMWRDNDVEDLDSDDAVGAYDDWTEEEDDWDESDSAYGELEDEEWDWDEDDFPYRELGFFSSIGSGFRSFGNSIRDTANKAGNGIRDTANKAGNGIKDTANKAGNGITDTANKAGNGIKDTAVKAGAGIKQGAFVVGGALGIPGTGPDHDKVQRELEAKVRGLKMPQRQTVQKTNGFTFAAGQTGVHYETVTPARMDKNMAVFMGNVITEVEKKMKAANLNFNDLRSRQDSERAFGVLDQALAGNPLVKPIRRNQVTDKSIRKGSTDAFKFNGKASEGQKEQIKQILKEMINDNEIWFSFSNNGVGEDKVNLINEAFSQTGVTVTSLATLIHGRDSFKVHVADLAYLKFPKALDKNSNLKIYFLAIDAWFDSERTLFIEKNSAGLDFHMRVSEFGVNNDALNKLNPDTKAKNAAYAKQVLGLLDDFGPEPVAKEKPKPKAGKVSPEEKAAKPPLYKQQVNRGRANKRWGRPPASNKVPPKPKQQQQTNTPWTRTNRRMPSHW